MSTQLVLFGDLHTIGVTTSSFLLLVPLGTMAWGTSFTEP